ncbi:MAG: VF530 family protein [Gemmatimonadota bacterium]
MPTPPTPPPPPEQERNPLHGVTLERMLTELEATIGWAKMARRVRIACFTLDPSVSSSLKFLRRTPWAREKVERMYIDVMRQRAKRAPAPE